MTLIPAYGRDYRTKAQVQADWDADRDFQCVGSGAMGAYINRSGAVAAGLVTVSVRYAQNRKVCQIRVK